uniref:Uncharacterized protein n=1 Tax=Cacopsylla melanoneura TaxID=428564 RepID=A0A8D8R0G2_9HEMI
MARIPTHIYHSYHTHNTARGLLGRYLVSLSLSLSLSPRPPPLRLISSPLYFFFLLLPVLSLHPKFLLLFLPHEQYFNLPLPSPPGGKPTHLIPCKCFKSHSVPLLSPSQRRSPLFGVTNHINCLLTQAPNILSLPPKHPVPSLSYSCTISPHILPPQKKQHENPTTFIPATFL